jgi:hypothetical protein
MSVALTLRSIKGSRLTNTEIDNNFDNISDELDLKATTLDPEFTGLVTVTGDLLVTGTTTFVNTQNLSIADTTLYLNRRIEGTITAAAGNGTNVVYTVDNNYTVGDFLTVTGVTPSSFNVAGAVITGVTSTTVTIASANTNTYVSGGETYSKTAVNPDLGIVGGYNSTGVLSGYAHSGIFRDASDSGIWKFYDGYTPEPVGTINTSDASFSLASIAAFSVTANDFNSTSDIKLKKNISVIENALDIVNQLEGVNFEWKDSGKKSIGVIAQQVEQVVPNIVITGSDGIKRVSYDSLIPILIEAIKELSAKIK